jgi:hypothetical protein
VAKGLATDDNIALGLLAQVGESVSPLGHILVRHNLIDQQVLEDALKDLAVNIVERATSDPRDGLDFEGGGTAGQHDNLLGSSTAHLILRSARVVDDAGARSAAISRVSGMLRLCAPLEVIMFDGGFAARELTLMQQIDGDMTVEELREHCHLGSTELDEVLYGLLLAGYVEILPTDAGTRTSASPSPSRKAAKKSEEASPTEVIEVQGAAAPAPDEASQELYRHEQLLRFGDVPNAFQRLERVCELAPTPEHLHRLAVFMREHEMATARILETLRLALEMDPKSVGCWIELARFWERHNCPERQRKALVRALHLDPKNPEARAMSEQLRV